MPGYYGTHRNATSVESLRRSNVSPQVIAAYGFFLSPLPRMAMFSSMMCRVRPFAILSTSLVLLGATLPAQTGQSFVPNRIVSPIDENARTALHGYVHPLANAANDRGAAPDSMPLPRMHLVLSRSASQEAIDRLPPHVDRRGPVAMSRVHRIHLAVHPLGIPRQL